MRERAVLVAYDRIYPLLRRSHPEINPTGQGLKQAIEDLSAEDVLTAAALIASEAGET